MMFGQIQIESMHTRFYFTDGVRDRFLPNIGADFSFTFSRFTASNLPTTVP